MKRFTSIVFVSLSGFAAIAQNLPQLGVTLDPQGLPLLSWQSKSNWFYRVEAATHLIAMQWTTLAVSNLQVGASNGLISTKVLTRVPGVQFYRVRARAIRPFGVMSLSPKFSTAPADLNDLGASWARFNVFLDGSDKPFTDLLDAGVNLVITFQNRDPANVNTNYGSLLTYSKAGFPFLVESNYQQDIRAYLAPAEPYLTLGQQVWVQCENEVDDVTHNTNSLYWCGTTAQYLANNLAALYQTAHAMVPPLPVVLASFASEKLDQVSVPPINTGSLAYTWQTNFFLTLLSQGTYDSADLHFYGYATNIQSKIQWLKNYLPPGKPWISTENGGPDSRVAPFISWTNTFLFGNTESNEVPVRLDACLTNNAAITMWFSLYDFLPDTNTIFGHLGLMLPSGGTDTPKPAYYSFKNYTAAH